MANNIRGELTTGREESAERDTTDEVRRCREKEYYRGWYFRSCTQKQQQKIEIAIIYKPTTLYRNKILVLLQEKPKTTFRSYTWHCYCKNTNIIGKLDTTINKNRAKGQNHYTTKEKIHTQASWIRNFVNKQNI